MKQTNTSIINEYRNYLFPTLARTSPVTFSLLLLLNCVLNPTYNAFYLLIMYVGVFCSELIITYLVMKPLFLITGNNTLFQSFGQRPANATSCNFTMDNKLSTTFGLPSNHSQIAWTVSSYIICKLIVAFKAQYETNQKSESLPMKIMVYIWLGLSFIITLSIGIYISYTRVYIEECNTTTQIIFSTVLGITYGFLIFWFQDQAVNFMQSLFATKTSEITTM